VAGLKMVDAMDGPSDFPCFSRAKWQKLPEGKLLAANNLSFRGPKKHPERGSKIFLLAEKMPVLWLAHQYDRSKRYTETDVFVAMSACLWLCMFLEMGLLGFPIQQ